MSSRPCSDITARQLTPRGKDRTRQADVPAIRDRWHEQRGQRALNRDGRVLVLALLEPATGQVRVTEKTLTAQEAAGLPQAEPIEGSASSMASPPETSVLPGS